MTVFSPLRDAMDWIGCGSVYTWSSWIGLDWVSHLVDWVGLDLAKWTHVQLWFGYNDRMWQTDRRTVILYRYHVADIIVTLNLKQFKTRSSAIADRARITMMSASAVDRLTLVVIPHTVNWRMSSTLCWHRSDVYVFLTAFHFIYSIFEQIKWWWWWW